MRDWGLKIATFAVLFSEGAAAQIVRPFPPIGPPQQMTARLGRAAQNARSVIHGTAVDNSSTPLPSATAPEKSKQH